MPMAAGAGNGFGGLCHRGAGAHNSNNFFPRIPLDFVNFSLKKQLKNKIRYDKLFTI